MMLNHSELIDNVYTTDLNFLPSSDQIQIEKITSKELEKLSAHKSPNGCVAVVQFPKITPTGKFTIVLDEIQDPGNLGTIIRLADWYGIDDIVCSKTTVDCFNSKVVQACMGPCFDVQSAMLIWWITLNKTIARNTPPCWKATTFTKSQKAKKASS